MYANLSELAPIVSVIDPDAYTAAAYNGDVIDMSLFSRVMFIVMSGTLGSSATLDFNVQGGTTSAGATNDVSGWSITQLTQAGSDDDKQVILEIGGEAVAVEGYRYLKPVLTVGTATSDCGMIALGFKLNYGLAADNDLASVDEIIQRVN